MIRNCTAQDFDQIISIINESAEIYRGVIPEDRWKEPYMSADELAREISTGVRFSGYELNGELVAVMGIQDVQDVTLIRHAYTRGSFQGQGLGKALLAHLCCQTDRPVLIGTWADATWAIGFYKKQGFIQTSVEEKTRLLKKYWNIPLRQVETSVVLANGLDFLQGETRT